MALQFQISTTRLPSQSCIWARCGARITLNQKIPGKSRILFPSLYQLGRSKRHDLWDTDVQLKHIASLLTTLPVNFSTSQGSRLPNLTFDNLPG